MKDLRPKQKIAPIHVGAVIAAAGSSSRMRGTDKITADILGIPVIVRAAIPFSESGYITDIVVVTRKESVPYVRDLLKKANIKKLRAVIPGGSTRQESVRKALAALPEDLDYVAVHDGARPLVTQRILTEAVQRAIKSQAAIPAVAVTDTIRELDENGRIIRTPQRDRLRAMQTPQVFKKELLLAAWEKAEEDGLSFTDDGAAVEHFGVSVSLTRGSEENLKITTPLDLLLAEAVVKEREKL